MKKTIFPKVALTLILLLIGANSAAAYDNDTHFWLTYYLARKVGYTHIQAMQIASADISVDLDKDTKPVTPRLRFLEISDYPKIHGEVRYKFHALPRKEEANKITGKPYLWWNPNREEDDDVCKLMTKLVDERKSKFWKKTLEDKRNPGMFMHFLQDSFSHRGFKGYIGHAGYSKIDFLASDEKKTTLMVKETLRY
jgi:hypothetical protein